MILKQYDHKVDIWSSGVIFYILLTGTPPFNAVKKNNVGAVSLDSENIKRKILKGVVNYDLPVFKQIDKRIVEILKSMLNSNPKERPDAVTILQHSIFSRDLNWKQHPEGKL